MGKFDKDSLGNRMKSYEAITDNKLVPRMPMIIRLDGSSFHTFTRGLKRPFDTIFLESMRKTMRELCEKVDTCKFGYTQSDEITLVCRIDDVKKTQGYMNYEINKILSKTAAMCTLFFNRTFRDLVNAYDVICGDTSSSLVDKEVYLRKLDKAFFDCRVFNVPDWEVFNNLVWRQQDCVRNSILSVAQSQYSAKEMHGKNCSVLQDMLMEKGINWNDLPTEQKRGVCCYKDEIGWAINYDMPILTDDEGRKLISDKIFNNELEF